MKEKKYKKGNLPTFFKKIYIKIGILIYFNMYERFLRNVDINHVENEMTTSNTKQY